MFNKKYATCIKWGHNEFGEYYDKCFISYSTPEVEKYDGFNMVGRGGDDGIEYTVSDTLEEALVTCNYNPNYITFDISEEDLKLKDQILKKYMWDKEKGLVKR